MNDDAGSRPTRRQTLTAAGVGVMGLPGCQPTKPVGPATPAKGAAAVLGTDPLGTLWPTVDPFLFCAYHNDAYPVGNDVMGPAVSLQGRNIGQDFEGRDGWRMYHGETIPGFPQHPHRGFETVTVTRQGTIDHADSLGATARYGNGDVQWLTAGAGIVHAEMFPLIDRNGPNPLELFQIWLNLPAADKFADPHFSMFWHETLQTHVAKDAAGNRTSVTIIAGPLADAKAPAPPPRSWAARPESEVAIWTIKMDPGARWTLPAAAPGLTRALYYYRGDGLYTGDRPAPATSRLRLQSDIPVDLINGKEAADLLLLQGRPIGEPVVQYGPFVMNTRTEIQQAFADYQKTSFGGWPWQTPDPVHARTEGRFAIHADGKREKAG